MQLFSLLFSKSRYVSEKPTSKSNFLFFPLLPFLYKQVWKYQRIVIVVIFHVKLLVSNEIPLWSTVYTMNNLFVSEGEASTKNDTCCLSKQKEKDFGLPFFLDFMSRKQLIFRACDIDTINYCEKMKNISSLKITRSLSPLLLRRLAVQYIPFKHQSSKPQLTSSNRHVPTMEMDSFSLSFLYLSKTYSLLGAFDLIPLQVSTSSSALERKSFILFFRRRKIIIAHCSTRVLVFGWVPLDMCRDGLVVEHNPKAAAA